MPFATGADSSHTHRREIAPLYQHAPYQHAPYQHALVILPQSLLHWQRSPDPPPRPAWRGMERYGLPSKRAIGVPMGAIKVLAKTHGPDHQLACALWPGGTYEAQILALHQNRRTLG